MVDGWNNIGAFTAIAEINKIQLKNKLVGNIGEIGVHEGQLFCALALLADTPCEGYLAIDVFDNQKRNIDKSGGASFTTFRNHVGKVLGDRQKSLHVIEKDSLSIASLLGKMMTIVAIGRNGQVSTGPITDLFRLFSVDGGHSVVHVLNDLRLVERAMTPGGVVIVDDFMNPKWPGVTEGLHIYCTDRSSRLVPFAYGNGKMYLATFDYRDEYIGFSTGHKLLKDSKLVELYGRKMLWVDFGGAP